ncbi:MAG TPA: nitrile hydratase subunit beta [Thermomicrobiales bacterium]|nr:nitrile hydratase subunit beta [Thermomicrobiales bacterium]
MNGVHDLGGMHGFGPVAREASEPLFHAAWEGRVCALEELLCGDGRYFTLDAFRAGIERMAPVDYLRASYYERWLASIEHNLIDEGLLAGDELGARIDRLRGRLDAAPATVAAPPAPTPRPPSLPPSAPRFSVGDLVVARNIHPIGHTRLPRYARGKRGVIQRLHGAQTFPDTNAHGLGSNPQPLYTVQFLARELWGESAEPSQTVSLELWDSYLERPPD